MLWRSPPVLTHQLLLLCRLTALQTTSERSLATPATCAFVGGLAAYALFANTPAARAEADVTVCSGSIAIKSMFLSCGSMMNPSTVMLVYLA